MKHRLTKLGGWMLLVSLIGSLVAVIAGAGSVAAIGPGADPVRTLPATVAPGEEFEVTVTFTAPCDEYRPGFSDTAPAGWTVSVDPEWCEPEPFEGSTPEPNRAEYAWVAAQDEGVAYSVVYKVQVPAGAEPGVYDFSGILGGYCGTAEQDRQPIGGDYTITVEELDLDPPAVSTLAATGVTHNRATLNGNLTDIGDYTQVRVRFQWGTTMAYGNETPWQTRTGTGSFNALITGLAPETTYHFRAQVETIAPSNTVTEHGENMTFTTLEEPVDVVPPVGGTGYPTNRLALLAPWLGLAAVVAGALVFVRRRHAQS